MLFGVVRNVNAASAPAKPSITSVSVLKNALRVDWKKAKNAKQYELIIYINDSKYKTATTKNNYYVIKGLPVGYQYKFKIRSVNGKSKSAYSTTKNKKYGYSGALLISSEPSASHHDVDTMKNIMKKRMIGSGIIHTMKYDGHKYGCIFDDWKRGILEAYYDTDVNSTVYFYYSGHSVGSKTNPIGLSLNPDNCVTFQGILQTLAKYTSGKVILIVDACFSAELINKVKTLNSAYPGVYSRFNILTSCKSNEYSSAGTKDSNKGGFFTNDIKSAMANNLKRRTTLKQLYDAVKKGHHSGKSANGTPINQTPQMWGTDGLVIFE